MSIAYLPIVQNKKGGGGAKCAFNKTQSRLASEGHKVCSKKPFRDPRGGYFQEERKRIMLLRSLTDIHIMIAPPPSFPTLPLVQSCSYISLPT